MRILELLLQACEYIRHSRLCKVMYDLMLKMYADGSYKYYWIDFIKTTLDNLGSSFIFSQQGNVDMTLKILSTNVSPTITFNNGMLKYSQR